MYTSGSTGRPKGISIPHRAVTRLVVNTDYVSLGVGDRIAQAANASFDAATFEIWGALLNGGTVVGIPKSVLLSVDDLATELTSRRITTMFLTTALFQQVAREKPMAFGGLRELLYGGEVCDPRLVARVLAHGGPQRLLHVYGPTESTTFATWHLVESVSDDLIRVPIGKPIANTTAYVLDADRRLVPPGVPGELYLGGDGLAAGYLEREELTAERFVRSPLHNDERLYRTGDLVRWTAEGTIEYLDRLDQQVKIRGFRIELPEVETALRTCAGVADAVVLARPDPSGAKRLVAYFTPKNGRRPDPAEIRAELCRLLPSYMTPSAIVTLDAFPLNPNGKIDRKALPDPSSEAGVAAQSAASEPAGELEQQITSIWKQVLERDSVGRHENFFDLGGHSLLITRVHAQVKSKLGLSVPIVDLFHHPTVASLAARLSGGMDAAEGLAEARSRAEARLSARERRRKRALSPVGGD
jgi:acyl-coenzyme A synthetase/AMP-(fatty) acid ligase